MGSGSDVNNGGSGGGATAKSGTGVWSSDGHGYCLRWNNHKSNLVEILEALIKMECYVDCTIYVDNHVQFKAHRVVLAACSPYFQAILQDAPQDHCSIIFPGVQEFEMRTLLEYIYAGEVNIAESQIPRIMKIAKMLEVKGLLDMVDLTSNISHQQQPTPPNSSNLFRSESHASALAESKSSAFPLHHHPLTHSSPIISTSTKISSAQSSSSPPYTYKSSPYVASLYAQSPSGVRDLIAGAGLPSREEMAEEERGRHWPALPLPLSRNAQSMLSSVYETGSDMNPLKRKKLSSISSMLMTRDTPILRNVLAQSNAADSSQGGGAHPLGANAGSPSRAELVNRGDGNGNGSDNIENNDSNNNTENNGNNAGNNASGGNNGSVYVSYVRKSGDRSYHSSNGSDNSEKKYKDDEPASPLTERSFDDEPMNDSRRRESPPEFLPDMRIPAYLQQQAQFQQAQFPHHGAQGGGGGGGGIGGGGGGSGSQKPEWKRYKQYTRNDIMSAIECVRNGMSALQASRKFGVPSRTLYDKVKKLGITTGTPRNRSSSKREPGPSSSSAAFPYGSLSGAAGAFLYPNQDNQLSQSQDFDSEIEGELKHHRPNPHAGLLDPVFLQKLAAEARSDEFRGDALHAMALAAAAHAQFNGMGSSSRAHDSPGANALSKFINRHNESLEMERERMDRERSRSNGDPSSHIKREPLDESDDEHDVEMEKAENLSLSKHASPPNVTPPLPPQTPPPAFEARGVIVPPMKYASPRSEPSSTTPPSISEQALALDKQQSFSNDAPIALTPTTTANYDD